MKINATNTTAITKINGVSVLNITKINGSSFTIIPAGIVLSDLIMYLDAGVIASYPGTGTNWNDLTVNNNDATLTNGPTYNSSNGGSIVFDGANDYGQLLSTVDIGTVGTWSIWINANSFSGVIIGSNIANYYMIFNYASVFYINYGGALGSVSHSLSTGAWYNITITRNGNTHEIFVNGESIGTTTISTANTSKFSIIGDERSTSPYPFNGKISSFLVYDRVLTSSEVIQNFNALVDRYLPLPSNKFDASNVLSYPGSGTTWYNISGSSNTTLYNGVTYSTDGGGSLVFDGTSNYGIVPYDSTFNFSTGDYTMNTWVKFNNLSSPMNITSKDTYGSNFDWSIYIPNANNIIDYSNGTATNVSAYLGTALSTGTWYLITISSISSYVSIYVNGVQYGSTTYMSTSNSNTTALTIGCYSWNNPGALFNGKISVMEYYNVGLTSTEALMSFTKNKTRFGY